MGEEKAASIVVPIAKRVQRNNPDAAPIGLLVAAAATLFLAGYTDPKDRHVLHAAERMRDRLADAPLPPPAETEERKLSGAELAEIERLRPRWDRAREILEASVPDSTFALWLAPLILCGRLEHTILVGGPPQILSWSRRRYGGLLLEALHAAELPADRVRWVDWLPINDDSSDENTDQGGTT